MITGKSHSLIRQQYLLSSIILLFIILCISSGTNHQQGKVAAQPVEFFKCNLNTVEQVASSRRAIKGRNFIPESYSFMKEVKRSTSYERNDAECTLVPLSIDPDVDEQTNPQTQTLNVFVKRFRATPGKNAPKALWLIMGGPGSSTIFFEPLVSGLVDLTKGQFDIYMMDHRGVARSTRAGCDGAQAETPGSVGGQTITNSEWPECYASFKKEWANGLHNHLNSKTGAIDLAKLITKINVPLGQNVFVYGTSYGTVLVTRFMRYLELSGKSNLVKGAILDSVISTKGSFGRGITSFDRFDAGYDFVAKQLLQICGNVERARGDDTCLKHLGQDVKNPNYLNEFFEKLYSPNSMCPEFAKIFTSTQTKSMFGELIASRGTRHLLPALVYRIKRCDKKKDIPLFQVAYSNYFGTSEEEQEVHMLTHSELTQFNIALSELWDPSTTQEILDQRLKSYTAIPRDSGKEFQVSQLTKWNTYNLDSLYYNNTFKTSSPVMLLNGDLDPDTPLYDAQTHAANIEGNSKGGLVVIDFATHVTLMSSPQTGSPYPCGMELIANFITMDDPNVNNLDRTCLSKLQFTFKGTPKGNLGALGIEDIYDGSLNPESSGKSTGMGDKFTMNLAGFIILISILCITIVVLASAFIGTTCCACKQNARFAKFVGLDTAESFYRKSN